MKIKCAITGYNGVLGKTLVKTLPYKFIKFKGDIRNKKLLKKWFKKNNFDIFIHLAAVVSIKDVKKNLKKAYDINFIGTKNIVDEILKYKNLKWFFFASTSHVYRYSNSKITENSKISPISNYGSTKSKAEKYIIKKLKKKNKYCIGRIFSFTSKLQSKNFVVPAIMEKIKSKKKEIMFSNLEHFRDFISVEDIVNAIFFLQKKNSEGIFNIGSGEKTLLSDIPKFFLKNHNKKILFFKNKKKTCLVSDNTKLKKTGWRPKSNILEILKKLS